jgi:gas vesicle protein
MKKFLCGMLIGAGVALMYAPASGSTTRAKMRDKGQKMAHDTAEYIDGKSHHLMNKMEGMKAQARHWAERVKDMLPTSEHMERDPDMAGV